jgi:hypothetical protein
MPMPVNALIPPSLGSTPVHGNLGARTLVDMIQIGQWPSGMVNMRCSAVLGPASGQGHGVKLALARPEI